MACLDDGDWGDFAEATILKHFAVTPTAPFFAFAFNFTSEKRAGPLKLLTLESFPGEFYVAALIPVKHVVFNGYRAETATFYAHSTW